jgi:hypothetical protein
MKQLDAAQLSECTQHVSLYAFEHIIQYGQYFFNLKLRDRKDALSNAHAL